jgi:predicted nucleic acid-binding protein
VTTVVIDTSVALKWVLTEDHTAEAIALRNQCIRENVEVLAPSLLRYEAINVLAKKVIDGLLAAADIGVALRNTLALIELRDFDLALSLRAVAFAASMPHRRFGFDAQFLALAEHERCVFWTADRDFADSMGAQYPSIRWIGAYSPLTR